MVHSYYKGINEDLEGTLDKYHVASITSYGTQISRKNKSIKVRLDIISHRLPANGWSMHMMIRTFQLLKMK